MNSSGTSFKVRAAAAEELDRLSLGSKNMGKKKSVPRLLKPLPNTVNSKKDDGVSSKDIKKQL